MENLELQEMQHIEGGNWAARVLCSIFGGGPCTVYVDEFGTGYGEIWFP